MCVPRPATNPSCESAPDSVLHFRHSCPSYFSLPPRCFAAWVFLDIYIYVLLILGSKGSLSLSQRGFPASSLSIANFFCLSVAFITNSYTLTLVVRRTFSNNTNKRHCSSSQICLAVSTQNNLLIYSVFGAAIASKRQQVAIIERSEG